MSDLISREDAVKEIHKYFFEEINKIPCTKDEDGDEVYTDMPTVNSLLVCNKELSKRIKALLSAEAEWIPCSERLPEDSGNYLVCPSDSVIEDYSDVSEVMIMPYDADCEAFGLWSERYDPISLGFVDSDFDEFEVIAWQPLPKPYKESEVEE